MQATDIGEVDRLGIIGVGVELAYVVQQRACNRDIPVDPSERGRDRADGLGDQQAVLEQTVSVSLVVVLGGWSGPVGAPGCGFCSQDALEQLTQVRLLDGPKQLPEILLHLLRSPRRAIEEVGKHVRSWLRTLDRAQVDLGPEAGMHRVAAANMYRLARPSEPRDVLDLLPDHRDHCAAAVAQPQAQVVATVAPLPALELTHEQYLVDLHTIA